MDVPTKPKAAERIGDADPAFRKDVLAGLAEPQKAIPARWFYDYRGSQLFEQITALPEYNVSRVETALLERHGPEIAQLSGNGRALVEFGSGSSAKTRLLLRELRPWAYVPIDISGSFLRQACAELAPDFPATEILPVEANFMEPVPLPIPDAEMLGFFPGSTIGNLTPAGAAGLLRSMRATLGERSHLVIGFDCVKGIGEMVAAYDDAQGVTARFNLNVLERINRELEADVPVQGFRHVARWNPVWSRIEMHLEAREDLDFAICGQRFSLRAGETIHTENSHKYTADKAELLLQTGGWTPIRQWQDDRRAFLIVLAEATRYRFAP